MEGIKEAGAALEGDGYRHGGSCGVGGIKASIYLIIGSQVTVGGT